MASYFQSRVLILYKNTKNDQNDLGTAQILDENSKRIHIAHLSMHNGMTINSQEHSYLS